MGISYKEAGVDRDLGDKFVERIRGMVASTYTDAVESGVGGFASLYRLEDDRLLAAGTDGVGTKLKLAQDLGIHQTIGIDLVAMCVNDVLCTGARPLFFLDYFACGKLDLKISEAVVAGIVDGCKQAGAALVGGETAEMPGLYAGEDYDLAGFCVGEISRKDLLTGKSIEPGDILIALPSSGFHSNGYSLVRKLLQPGDEALKKAALTPTTIYVKPVLAALGESRRSAGFTIKGLAHMTGSGFYNVPRMNESVAYQFDAAKLPQPPAFMSEIMARSGLDQKELYSTFNMGTGMVVAVDKAGAAKAVEFFRKHGLAAVAAGEVIAGKGFVEIGTLRLE